MKQTIPTPIAAIAVVAVVLVIGVLLVRQFTGPSHATASPTASHVAPPPVHYQKPDFSKMTPDQINAFKGGGQAKMFHGGAQ